MIRSAVMNMVTRNLVWARMKNSMNFRSMVTTIDNSEQEVILCLNVWAREEDDIKWRCYAITPPASTASPNPSRNLQKKSPAAAISFFRFITTSTQVKLDPSLLCEIIRDHLPEKFVNVALDSKIHLIADASEDNCLPQVLDIDTSSLQITAENGQPMNSGKGSPGAVVLDGKIYVFDTNANGKPLPAAEVFDPITKKWDYLPPLSDTIQEFYPFRPVVYNKAKKIFFFCGTRRVCAFDVNSNSWEYGVEMPEKVLQHMKLRDGHADVIVDDVLYMFYANMFFAYDLRERKLLKVHGLERETLFLVIENQNDWVGLRGDPIFLVQVGKKKDICLVTSKGPVSGGLHVVCIKFRFEKTDGGLYASFLGRDSYHIQDAVCIQGCVAM